jgi:hypothetical protein
MDKSGLMGQGRPLPDLTTIVIAVLVVIWGILVFSMVFNQPGVSSTQTESQSPPSEFAQGSQEIIPGADMILSSGDTTLFMPKGATSQTGYISITPRAANPYVFAGNSGWVRPLAVNIEYRSYKGASASSISFFKPVLICFRINGEQWQDYTRHPDAYQVETYAETLFVSRWIVLPQTTKPERLELCGETHHLSLYALAINPKEAIQPPIIPITGPTQTVTDEPTQPGPADLFPTRTRNDGSYPGSPPIVPPTAIKPTSIPTAVPPTVAPTAIPPTAQPTEIVPTEPPTEVEPTGPPATEPPTEIEPTDPPATEPPATEPPATEPPATEPPATEPPATDPPATDPPATDPASPDEASFCFLVM